MRTLRGVGVMAGMSLLLALVGCGSSSKTTSTTTPVAATPTTTAGSVKPVTYNIKLAHVTGSSGAADAAGVVRPECQAAQW